MKFDYTCRRAARIIFSARAAIVAVVLFRRYVLGMAKQPMRPGPNAIWAWRKSNTRSDVYRFCKIKAPQHLTMHARWCARIPLVTRINTQSARVWNARRKWGVKINAPTGTWLDCSLGMAAEGIYLARGTWKLAQGIRTAAPEIAANFSLLHRQICTIHLLGVFRHHILVFNLRLAKIVLNVYV